MGGKIWRILMTEVRLPKFLRFEKTEKMLRGKDGSALMIAIFAVSFMILIATEVMYETSVEFVMSSKSVDQVKAYYAAKAGLEISLLRIQIYRKARNLIGDMLPDKSMLEMIWQFPFAWPPSVPTESKSIKADIDKITKRSGMQAKYLSTITSEGSKIDINDLGSPSKVIAQSTHQQILNIFTAKVKNDEAFAETYRSFDFDKLINSIADWVSDGTTSLNGGDKRTAYQDLKNEFLPPNQPFKTIQELHMVAGMNDDFYNLLIPSITVFGTHAINVNQASKEILMSLSPSITDERAQKVITAIANPSRGPFKDINDFLGFLQSLGITGNPFQDPKTNAVIPLTFGAETNFRIKSTGISGKVQKTIEAVVYDSKSVKANLEQSMKDQQAAQNTGGAGATPTATPTPGPGQTSGQANNSPSTPKIDVPNERPNVIYWEEN